MTLFSSCHPTMTSLLRLAASFKN